MATGAAKVKMRQGEAGSSSQYDALIEGQLTRTQRQIKLDDLASLSMMLLTCVLAFLLIVALIDHWVIELGFWGRLLALVTLVGGVIYFCVSLLWPPLIRRINPVYAARAIEQSTPSLKNSLINFLMFRSQPSGIRGVVLEALRQRAAVDLSGVHVETTVDRSRIIRIGYVLVAVLILCAAYRIASPKNPFQTVARVMAPWADIARPSRVQIEDVQPGDDEVFHGQAAEISARVRAAGDEPVTVYYTTNDRRIVDQPVDMQWDESTNRYHARLPEGDEGIQQDLSYRIEAGDAITGNYRLTVVAAPTILVERLEYHFPAYTQLPSRVVEQQGDIKALEGTRVTVFARANQPIGSAKIELDPDDGQQRSGPAVTRPSAIAMRAQALEARATLTLQLQADRQTPLHRAYQVRFISEAGHRSQRPIRHRIEVTRDLAPVVDILTPRKTRIEVAEDGRQTIEVRAVDPDYGLSNLRLRAVCGESELINESRGQDGRLGQVVEKFEFVPAQLGLAAGDLVTYHAIAEDNRTAPVDGSPQPNVERTPRYQILIVPASKPPAAEPSGGPSDQPRQQPTEAQPQDQGDRQQDPAQPDKRQPQAGQTPSEPDQPQPDQPEQQATEPDAPSGADDQQAQGGGRGQQADGAPEDQPAGGGQSAEDSGQPSEGAGGTRGGQGSQDQPASGQRSSQQPGGGSDSTADRREPLHDGEVIERVQQYLREQQPPGGGQGTQQSSGQQAGQQQTAPPQGAQRTSPASDANTRGGANPPSQATPPRQPAPQSGDAPRESQPQAPAGQTATPPQQPDDKQGEAQQRGSSSGEGGNPEGAAKPNLDKQPDRGQKQPGGDQQQGPGQGDNSQSGAGQDSQDESGSAQSQGENRDRQKTMRPEAGQPPEEGSQEPQSPSTSKRQSDSQGGKSGDRSGGGGKGAGQAAKQPGNDSAGSQRSADEGAGAANESGQGETADTAGQRQKAEGSTGAAGNQPGSGSSSRPDPAADQGQDSPAQGPVETPDQPSQRDPRPGAGQRPSGSSGQTIGGGLEGQQTNPPDPAIPHDQLLQPADDPNLEYSRKATSMALEYLRDQQQNPDQRLLDQLGWTQEDLKKFLDRWNQLEREASQGNSPELDEALRSLGLRPPRDKLRQGSSQGDQVRGLRDAGSRTNPPPGYAEQFNAYNKGVARSRDR